MRVNTVQNDGLIQIYIDNEMIQESTQAESPFVSAAPRQAA
jgi:hypothetical protein